MTDQRTLPLIAEDLEGLAAAALAQARVCCTVLRDVVIPEHRPLDRVLPEQVLRAIERRAIFTDRFAWDLDALVTRTAHEIERETTRYQVWDGSIECLSAGAWVENRRTSRGQRLAAALRDLRHL